MSRVTGDRVRTRKRCLRTLWPRQTTAGTVVTQGKDSRSSGGGAWSVPPLDTVQEVAGTRAYTHLFAGPREIWVAGRELWGLSTVTQLKTSEKP